MQASAQAPEGPRSSRESPPPGEAPEGPRSSRESPPPLGTGLGAGPPAHPGICSAP